MKLSIWHVTAALALLGLTRCAIPVSPMGTPSENDNDSVVPLSEDQDPATRALPFVADELLVQALPGAQPDAVAAAYGAIDATVIDSLPEIDLVVLSIEPGTQAEAAAALAETGLFENLQKNYVLQASRTPNDPQFSAQPNLTTVRAPTAWDQTVGHEEIVIAVVDTGVDAAHLDLESKVIGGWNVYDGNADYSDRMGHGTNVAGVAAASSNNGVGVTGVSWDSPVLAVRAAGADGASTSRHLAAGILWALGNGARVINVSFAPLHANTTVRAAAQQAYNRGALVVIASGNSGSLFTAAGYPEALFVGATDDRDAITSFSDRGPYVDMVAPGLQLVTTGMGGAYQYATGTSFAAPMVAGAAALAWSANPDLRPGTIADILTATTKDLGASGKDQTYGTGRLDVGAAVARAAITNVSTDTTAPSVRFTRPTDGSSQASRFTVALAATDATGVADVVLRLDGIELATDTRSPYAFTVDPGRYARGRHTLSAVATDLVGNTSTVSSIAVTFTGSSSQGAAGITFTSPAANATVSADTTITARVSSSVGLVSAEWYVDGESVLVSPLSGTSSTINLLWRAGTAAQGAHVVTVVVTDLAGGTTTGSLNLTRR
jgi:subtilisin family serine protease